MESVCYQGKCSRCILDSERKEYTLVSDSEANLKEGKIAVSTPIAQGLMGKKVGDIVEIRTCPVHTGQSGAPF